MKVLLVEDDLTLGTLLRDYFTEVKELEVEWVKNGEDALKQLIKFHPDIIIMDIMMPKMDGFETAKHIKKIDENVPIIFLSAKDMKEDVIQGFTIGADDYITKPFDKDELYMRMKAILKRTNKAEEADIITFGKYTLDTIQDVLKTPNGEIHLTTKESKLLELLARNKNQIINRSDALLKVWKEDTYFNARSMDVYISKLRKYLKDDPNIQIINVHGIGYKLAIENSE
jgi:DNA-binding response OmpR family regulator